MKPRIQGLSNPRFNLSSVASGPQARPVQNFSSIDEVISARTPEAINAIQRGGNTYSDYSKRGINEAIQATESYEKAADAQTEIDKLLGFRGEGAQRRAINGISVSEYDKELNRRQMENLQRGAVASGDVSGAAILDQMQLGGQQQADIITGRFNELMPLADLARQNASYQSQVYENAYLNRANQDASQGTQMANVRLGGVAPLIQNNLQQAQISGLNRIGEANTRGAVAGQLVDLASQYAKSQQSPTIQAYSGYSQPQFNSSYYLPSDTASGNYYQDMSGVV